MSPSAFALLMAACAPAVHIETAHALVHVESSFNSYAIGVVSGALQRQPRSRSEALATAVSLHSMGFDFSVGLAQINRRNFDRLGLTVATALDPCRNLHAMQTILVECIDRTPLRHIPQAALRQALSCYYSGNFTTGFKHGYVRRVAMAATRAGSSSINLLPHP